MTDEHAEIVEALTEIADKLDRLESLGANPQLRYDAVMTEVGYVWRTADGWAPRLKTGELPTRALVPVDED